MSDRPRRSPASVATPQAVEVIVAVGSDDRVIFRRADYLQPFDTVNAQAIHAAYLSLMVLKGTQSKYSILNIYKDELIISGMALL